MRTFLSSVTFAVGVVWTASSNCCDAQCLEWKDGFGNYRPGRVTDYEVFDDGSGPRLFVGIWNGITTWDGHNWSAANGVELVDQFNNGVTTMCPFDDGSGPALYVAGPGTIDGVAMGRIGRWDGSTWSAVGTGSFNKPIYSLVVWDDGTGPALYAGGAFEIFGSPSLHLWYVAKWDGTSWSPLGTGMDEWVNALAVFDDGSGSKLYATGPFTTAGGVPASGMARWDGTSWSAVGPGMGGTNPQIYDLEVFDDGSGPALYAGGPFTTAGGVTVDHVAKWDGTSWSAVGSGVDGTVYDLHVYDDGSDPVLLAGGFFTNAGGAPAPRVASWDGTSWSAVGDTTPWSSTIGGVTSLATFDSGSGPTLYAGGDFDPIGGAGSAYNAKWDGVEWRALGEGPQVIPYALATFDDGTGEALYVGGALSSAGFVEFSRIGRWDGSHWSALGAGLNDQVYALTVFDDGTGDALYAGGRFTMAGEVVAERVAKWDGTTWSNLDTNINGQVNALAAYDGGGGPALYAGGTFVNAGSVFAARVAKWDGASWSNLGAGVDQEVLALTVHDDGTGAALYAGGAFDNAGGAPAVGIARWNGTAWSPVGAGMGGTTPDVYALAVFDDGTGPKLYAAGNFTTAGGVSANRIAQWDGSSWSAVGMNGGMNGLVRALATFDDGQGLALYAAGSFTTVDASPIARIAKWSGASWSGLANGIGSSVVHALAVFEDGTDGAPDLYAGGQFNLSTTQQSSGLAQWLGCGAPGAAYCSGDGIDSLVTTPCPCGNFGDAGRGCANSNAALGGAHLLASGLTNPNTIVFTCDGIPNNTFCTFLRSNASLDTGFVFGDGIKCLNGTGIRFSSQNAGQNGNPPNTVSSGAAAIPAGNTRYYQLHYRNPNAGFCPPELFNISNGYRLDW